MIGTLFSDFDESVDEESESKGNIDAFTALNVGTRDWTVGTIVDQIKKGNIDLDPAFQRRSAWNDQKRSRFIESLILGVPIPQIVLAEQPGERGKFIVIDGKQRLLTLASLTMEKYSFWDKPKFQDINTIEDLDGKTIEEFTSSDKFKEERRFFENAPIRCAVLAGTNDKDVFYDIFYRLNSGAVPLSGQELRQVFYKGHFARYLFDVTNTIGPIHQVLGLTQSDPRLFDIELLLRYFAIRLALVPYRGDLRAYLDLTMKTVTDEWARYKPIIENLYGELSELLLSIDSYMGYNKIGRRYTSGRLQRRFNKAVFDVQVYYLSLVPKESLTPESKERFETAFSGLCDDADFRASVEATTKSIPRFELRFRKFRELVNDVFSLRIVDAPLVAE